MMNLLKHYSAKYPETTKYLEKDKDQMFSFYEFPAERRQHTRTTNPINRRLLQSGIGVDRQKVAAIE